MKKTLLTIAAALCAATAWAAALDYFVLQQSDGTCSSLTAVGTEITFSDGNLIASNPATGQSITIPLTALSRMYFSDAQITTGVDDLENTATEDAAIDVRAGRIFITGEAGTRVTVVTLAGVVVGEATLSGQSATPVTRELSHGVYVVKVNNNATKILVK